MLSALLVLALILALIGFLIVWKQEYLILPSLGYDTARQQPPPGIEEAYIKSFDSVKLRVWSKPGNPQGAFSGMALLFFHGNGDTVATSEWLLSQLSEQGITGFVMDYRGSGGNPGWPSEQAILTDAEQVFSYVLSRGYRPETMVLMGLSFGSGPASYLAAKEGVHSLVLVAPYMSISHVVKAHPVYRFLRSFLRIRMPVYSWVSKLGGTNLFLVHGKRDRVIPPHHSSELLGLYQGFGSKHLIIDPNSDHHDILMPNLKEIFEFLRLAAAGN